MRETTSVLMLEDEPIVALTLEDMLLEFGFEDVRVATTIDEAFRNLKDRAHDLAILNVNIRSSRSYGVAETLSSLSVPFFLQPAMEAPNIRRR